MDCTDAGSPVLLRRHTRHLIVTNQPAALDFCIIKHNVRTIRTHFSLGLELQAPGGITIFP